MVLWFCPVLSGASQLTLNLLMLLEGLQLIPQFPLPQQLLFHLLEYTSLLC